MREQNVDIPKRKELRQCHCLGTNRSFKKRLIIGGMWYASLLRSIIKTLVSKSLRGLTKVKTSEI